MPQPDNLLNTSRFAYVLAGGKSSRFGSSKALVCIDGIPQIQRLSDQLVADHWHPVAVSQIAKEFEPHGIRTIADIEPDQGPVAGILSGMLDLLTYQHSASPWALFITCDLWLWNPYWSKLLIPDHLVATSFGVGESPNGLLHHFQASLQSDGIQTNLFVPFPCTIHLGALPTIQEAWHAGCRSMRELIAILGPKAITRALPTELLPLSFNTLDDLQGLQRRVARDASHTPQ
jgi:molybdopterin-guanine dinucleotide biosynthesis protein A